MKFVLVRYNNDFEWAKEYTDDILIYDRSEVPLNSNNVIESENIGQVDYDKLTYLIDYYDQLPNVFVWAKANLLGRFVEKEYFEQCLENGSFAPLLRFDHKTQEPISFYDSTMMYNELNNSWYTGPLDYKLPNYTAFAKYMKLDSPQYLRFPPGGNFILTRERVHRYPRSFYFQMRELLPYSKNPAEAHYMERTYLSLWE